MQSVKNNVTVPPAHPSLQVTPEADPETLGFPGEEAIPGDTGRWWSSDTEGNQPGEGCDRSKHGAFFVLAPWSQGRVTFPALTVKTCTEYCQAGGSPKPGIQSFS